MPLVAPRSKIPTQSCLLAPVPEPEPPLQLTVPEPQPEHEVQPWTLSVSKYQPVPEPSSKSFPSLLYQCSARGFLILFTVTKRQDHISPVPCFQHWFLAKFRVDVLFLFCDFDLFFIYTVYLCIIYCADTLQLTLYVVLAEA